MIIVFTISQCVTRVTLISAFACFAGTTKVSMELFQTLKKNCTHECQSYVIQTFTKILSKGKTG